MKSYLQYRSEQNFNLLLKYITRPINEVVQDRLSRAFIIAKAIENMKDNK